MINCNCNCNCNRRVDCSVLALAASIIIGVVAGAVIGNLTGGNIIPGFTWGIAAVNNMVVSFACYYIGGKIAKK